MVLRGDLVAGHRRAAAGGGLYAVCSICPHQGCLFGFETATEAVGNAIGKDAANPVFFCRCHFSTYYPTREGKVLFGPSTRPPWRFTVTEENMEFVVTGVEPDVGKFEKP